MTAPVRNPSILIDFLASQWRPTLMTNNCGKQENYGLPCLNDTAIGKEATIIGVHG